MQHVHLISETNSLVLHGLMYPLKDEMDLGLAGGISQDGGIYVGRKAAPSLTLVRSFAGVRDVDYEALRDWYVYVAEGMRRVFSFVDGDGLGYSVRWLNGPSDWQKDGANRWSGTIRLRVEGFEP
ncbi:MAG: hypothetical protein C4520_03525 [Candidatus Abyssobacteria bacterium SURF_5]|uniref:Uncharacterized protein n=1 Tax=Abyssobacteria bacterium (strain SURF_5) TaxID=2093360 RepID=A0A3A4NWA7_ABYX5|nr:MAG: hypothetical protein C4520_03525 [Candidatus Abyssubacteria bacterium SURF_5]